MSRALARNTDPGCAALRFGEACPANDLVAVTLLSVEVPGPVALGVLEGKPGGQVDSLLAQIPTDIELHEPGGPELMATGSAARLAWDLLEEPWGMGWVVTSKVLARERPHLVPADDNVVKFAWESRGVRRLAARHAYRGRSGAGRPAPGRAGSCWVPESVSVLRVMDVAL